MSPTDDEVTPADTYFNRRTFLKRAAIVGGSVAATGFAYRRLNGSSLKKNDAPIIEDIVVAPSASAQGFNIDEATTPEAKVTHYNNFYEFTTDKDAVADVAAGFQTDGWKVSIEGMVGTQRVFDMDDIRKLSPPEERIYRMRCVEGWSMVIPWVGFSLSKLLSAVAPLGSAKYVAFESLHDPDRMPGQQRKVLDWPYVEGLRLDEAMHPLTILATGLYGRALPPQDGAPIRLVVPWKYGFKGIKSIVRISLVDSMPPTTWNRQAPREYGFYANVNPEVDHPRWSQATEQRIGESGRRKTLMFNGYGEQVASLYAGMDLRANY